MVPSFKDLFYSTQQARWTAIAVICAIIAICLSILFNNTDLNVSERFALISVIVLFSIPAVLISLFELNCISSKNVKHNWCGYWGWFIFFVITLQCTLIIISALMSMVTYNEATNKMMKYKEDNVVDKTEAEKVAKEMMSNNKEEKQGNVSMIGGYGMPQEFMPVSFDSNQQVKEMFKNKKKGKNVEGTNVQEKFKNMKKKEENVEGYNGTEYFGV
jgi:uncharacterized membrane protein